MTYPKPTIIAAIQAASHATGWQERTLIIDTAAALLFVHHGGTLESAEQQVNDVICEAAA